MLYSREYLFGSQVLITEFSGNQPVTATFNLGEKKGVAQVEFAPVQPGKATPQLRAQLPHLEAKPCQAIRAQQGAAEEVREWAARRASQIVPGQDATRKAGRANSFKVIDDIAARQQVTTDATQTPLFSYIDSG